MSQNNCPFCDSKDLEIIIDDVDGLNRADEMFVIKDYEYTVCKKCGEEFVTATQARHNEQKLVPLAQW